MSPRIASLSTFLKELVLNALDLRYEIPGQNHFSRIALPSFCASVKQRVKQDVSTLQCFSATTDM